MTTLNQIKTFTQFYSRTGNCRTRWKNCQTCQWHHTLASSNWSVCSCHSRIFDLVQARHIRLNYSCQIVRRLGRFDSWLTGGSHSTANCWMKQLYRRLSKETFEQFCTFFRYADYLIFLCSWRVSNINFIFEINFTVSNCWFACCYKERLLVD